MVDDVARFSSPAFLSLWGSNSDISKDQWRFFLKATLLNLPTVTVHGPFYHTIVPSSVSIERSQKMRRSSLYDLRYIKPSAVNPNFSL